MTPSAKLCGTTLVSCNKNGHQDPDVRARLVAQEVNNAGDMLLCAATPPLESKRLLLSQWATGRVRDGQPVKISLIGVRKAYINGRPSRKRFTRPPAEMGMPKHLVLRLDRCMHGARDVGSIWETVYTDALLSMGFVAGKASPCCVWHPEWKLSCVVRGDDFTCLGVASSLDKYEAAMQPHSEVKLKGRLGEGEKDEKSMRVLNKLVSVTEDGPTYEPDITC